MSDSLLGKIQVGRTLEWSQGDRLTVFSGIWSSFPDCFQWIAIQDFGCNSWLLEAVAWHQTIDQIFLLALTPWKFVAWPQVPGFVELHIIPLCIELPHYRLPARWCHSADALILVLLDKEVMKYGKGKGIIINHRVRNVPGVGLALQQWAFQLWTSL